jgi:hypothetical protein
LEKLYETNDLAGEEYVDPRSVKAFKKKEPQAQVEETTTSALKKTAGAVVIDDDDDDEDDYVAPTAASANRDPNQQGKSVDFERKRLIESHTQFYKSIDSGGRLKTTLMVNRPGSSMGGGGVVHFDDEKGSYVESDSDVEYSMIDEDEGGEGKRDADFRDGDSPVSGDSETANNKNTRPRSSSHHHAPSSDDPSKLVKSVKEMANILVKSAINLALTDIQSLALHSEDKRSGKEIEKMYRYTFSAKTKSEQSNSRLGYYKDYKTQFADLNESQAANDEADEANKENKFSIQFEDEPYEYDFHS